MTGLLSNEANAPRGEAVTMIVPVHNGGARFEAALRAVAGLDPKPDQVIVVDDGSTDASANLARDLGFEVLKAPERSGPAAARNLGAHRASGDLLFFIDADVEVRSDCVAEVRRLFREHPDISAVVGSYDDAPAEPNFFSQYKNLFNHYTHQNARDDAYTFWGACGAIRRTVFLELGGFDVRYLCIEDIEMGYRLKDAGHRIRMDKALQVKHLKRWDALSLFKTDFFVRAVPWSEIILQYGQFDDDLNIDIASRIKVVMSWLLVASTALIYFWWPSALILSLLCVGMIVLMDAPLLRFFVRQRGWWFAARVVPWQILYYFYSGVAFAWCCARRLVIGHRPMRQRLAGLDADQ